MSDVFRKLLDDQERLQKLTNPMRDLDKIINPAGNVLTRLSAAAKATDAGASHRSV